MQDFAASSTPDAQVTAVTLPSGEERIVWRRGVGRPLLLIMGMSGTHDHWGDVLVEELVGAGRSLISVNHRGVYRTPEPEAGYTVADLADDQAAALAALGIDEPIDVFGISMGGMTAQELALRHPEHVRTLALGCTTAGGQAMTPPSMEDLQLLFEAQQSGDRERALRAAFEINMSSALHGDAAVWERFAELSALAPVPASVILTQLQAIASHDTGGRLGELRVPTAVLHGTEDRMLPYPNATPLAEGIRGADLHTFDGAGHLFFWDDGARTARIVEELSAQA